MTLESELDQALVMLRANARRVGGPVGIADVLRVCGRRRLSVLDLEGLLAKLRGEGLFVDVEPATETGQAVGSFQVGPVGDSVAWFFQLASNYPLLDRDQERELGRRIAFGRQASELLAAGAMDPNSAKCHMQAATSALHALTLGNLRLVSWVLRSFRFGRDHHADLLQQGFLGLHRAATGFDPERDCRFSTYASWWIFQSTMAYLHDHGRVVRIPRHLSGDLNKVRRAQVRLFGQGILSDGAQIERLAEHLGFETVKVALLLALQADATSLSTQVGEDGTELGAMLVDTRVEEPTRNLEREELSSTLQRCMADLDDRSRAVIELRFGLGGSEPLTLEEVGFRMGVTRERIRQIEAKALQRLRVRERSNRLEAFLEDAA